MALSLGESDERVNEYNEREHTEQAFSVWRELLSL